MNTIITIEDIRAYSEVDYIVHHMNKKYVDMVPKKLLQFFSDMKDPNYAVKVNPYIPLQEQNLSEYSLELLALMHLKYWCKDENRKNELYNLMLSNESTLIEKMYERKNVETIFDSFEEVEVEKRNSQDFSKPKELEMYGNIEEAEEVSSDENVEDTGEINIAPKDSTNEKSIFTRIKEKILNFFNKNKQNA